ncbi:hypothetical protein [Staphylococcus simulans]|uniref:hypothetical protein n=1 Tax=Staphylococcus simulans TaxID=1286 RepID=UPI000E67A512|nr:hypothetical protein [Staphylococcus simulans]RIN77806.1 hypothetical protein BU015_04850 [Staphylococcus simulans]
MVKITVVKNMNLAELLNYIIKNEIREKLYYTKKGNSIWITKNGFINFQKPVETDDVFETIIDEEVTEETEIPLLLEIYVSIDNTKICSNVWEDTTISDVEDTRSIAFHMMKSEGTTTLLWTKEGGMQ